MTRSFRTHALIVFDGERYRLIDLGAPGGILLDGSPVAEVVLEPGDRLQLGSHDVRFIEHGVPSYLEIPLSATSADTSGPEAHHPGEVLLASVLTAPLPEYVPPRRENAIARLASLIRAGQIVNSQLNVRELMDKLMDCALSVVYADRASLQLVDRNSGELVSQVTRAREGSGIEQDPPGVSSAIMARTAELRTPTFSPDVGSDARFMGAGQDQPLRIRSAICVPLQMRDRLLGLLYVDTSLEGYRFTADEVALLAAFADQAVIALENARLYELAVTDELTQSYVRRYFDLRLREAVDHGERYGSKLTVMLLDLDHFKRINDSHGHPAGDLALLHVARVLRENVRNTDVTCRYGGEEFAVLFHEQSTEDSVIPAERIREAIESLALSHAGQTIHFTVSMGLASYPKNGRDADAVVNAADQALYEAKRRGRNQVCISQALVSRNRS